MEVIVVTSSKRSESELGQIIQLFESGMNTLHLRKPKWTDQELEELIKDIPEQYRNRIILHGHYNLAVKYKLKGIHLHRRHRSSSLKNRWKRFQLKLRRSSLMITSTFNSLESLRENKQQFDYVFLNSVFNSHSYYNQEEEAGMNMLRNIIRNSPCPVYALGGVTASKIPIVEKAGFEGVGLSSAVWKNIDQNPSQIFSLFQAA